MQKLIFQAAAKNVPYFTIHCLPYYIHLENFETQDEIEEKRIIQIIRIHYLLPHDQHYPFLFLEHTYQTV